MKKILTSPLTRIFLIHPSKGLDVTSIGHFWTDLLGGGWAKPPICKGLNEVKCWASGGSFTFLRQPTGEFSLDSVELKSSIGTPEHKSTANSTVWNIQ